MNTLKWIYTVFIAVLMQSSSVSCLRVLTLGDSITKGHNNASYRPKLYQNLRSLGYSVDFVGTQIEEITDETIIDQGILEFHHEVHESLLIRQANEQIGSWLDQVEDPDVILLHLGISDFLDGDEIGFVAHRYDALLLKIAKLRPNANIVATTLLQRGDSYDAQIHENFNSHVKSLVDSHASVGRRISFLDMQAMVPPEQVGTSFVPTQEGHVSMADAWARAIEAALEMPWRFINLSDWHLAEKYVFRRGGFDSARKHDIRIVEYIKKNYGGDFVMIPGDTNSGFWDRLSFRKKFLEEIDPNLTPSEIVMEAGNRCYGGMISTFESGGYPHILIAYGDHEAGDNPWLPGSLKSTLQPYFRSTFARNFNFDSDGNFLYNKPIGNVPSRPLGTRYENTSYAYKQHNVLFVTVDEFYQESSTEIVGKLGTVAAVIQGEHLDWLDKVLGEGRKDKEIKHIIVQGHFPVLYPVRKIKSSGMMMVGEANSDFWLTLRKHQVDIYFCGEVHANTVTKDPDSDLVQIASRGNYFTSFLTVDITNDSIDVTSYNEFGTKKIMYNFNYIKSGSFTIEKNNGMKSFESDGELAFLDRSKPLIQFNFEDIFPLESKPVLGISGSKGTLIKTSIKIREIDCVDSLPNTGEFGHNYDAQAANLILTQGGVFGKAGQFGESTRAAISGMGPHGEGNIVSFSLWFKTASSKNMILISYEGCWVKQSVLTFKLRSGSLELSYSKSQKLVTMYAEALNDDKWHHTLVTMPREDCFLSEIEIYIDGKQVSTSLKGEDTYLDLPRAGVLSLGGFGYAGMCAKVNTYKRKGYMRGSYFSGMLDDVLVWARGLSKDEINEISKGPIYFAIRNQKIKKCLGLGSKENWKHLRLFPCSEALSQQWMIDQFGNIRNRLMQAFCITTRQVTDDGDLIDELTLAACESVNQQNGFTFNEAERTIEYNENGKVMALQKIKGNNVVLEEKDGYRKQKWTLQVIESMNNSDLSLIYGPKSA